MDREILYRLLKIGKILLINDDIAAFRIHEGSKTTGNVTTLKSYLETRDVFSGFFSGNRKEDRKRKKVMMARIALGYIYAIRNTKKKELKIKYILLALYSYPACIFTKPLWYSLAKI